MNKQIIILIIAVVVISSAGSTFLIINLDSKDDDGSGQDIPAGSWSSFPSKDGQYLNYKLSSDTDRMFKVVEKTSVENVGVFKVEFGTKDINEETLSYPQYLYVDIEGKVWKVESENGYSLFNYETNVFYNSYTDETGELPQGFVYTYQLMMGSWWKNQYLSIGKEFSYKLGENPEYLYDITFKVLKTEEIQVPAGVFNTYKVEVIWIDEGESTTADYYVDTENYILVKWMTSPSNGDDLKEYNI